MLAAFSIGFCSLAAQHAQHKSGESGGQPPGAIDHSMPEGHHHDTSMTSEPPDPARQAKLLADKKESEFNHHLELMARIQSQHLSFALVGIGIGLTKGLSELRVPWQRMLARLWPLLMVALGVLLMLYWE